jgi:hypothetical protein
MKISDVLTATVIIIVLVACGNPGGIDDAAYAKYKELGAPKILYSCDEVLDNISITATISDCISNTDSKSCIEDGKKNPKHRIDVGYVAGIGAAVTYNKLLNDAKAECHGDFKVLDSKS